MKLSEIADIPKITKLRDFIKYIKPGEAARDKLVIYKGQKYHTSMRPLSGGYEGRGFMVFVDLHDPLPSEHTIISVQFCDKIPSYIAELSLATEDDSVIEYDILDAELNAKNHFPDLNVKEMCLKKILQTYKDGAKDDVKFYIHTLNAVGINWPELDAIEKSLKAFKKS